MFRWPFITISFRSATFIILFTQLFLIYYQKMFLKVTFHRLKITTNFSHLWLSWEIVMSWFISQRTFIKYILKYITHIRKNVEILWRDLLEVCLIAISTKRSYKSWLITLFSIHNFMFKPISRKFFQIHLLTKANA